MIARDTALSIERLLATKNDELFNYRTLLVENSVSNYPIFCFQKSSKEIIGKQIIDERMNDEKWNVFLTHLEELYAKKIILEEKLNDFMLHYKNNNDHFCILFIDQSGNTGFAFYPIELYQS